MNGQLIVTSKLKVKYLSKTSEDGTYQDVSSSETYSSELRKDERYKCERYFQFFKTPTSTDRPDWQNSAGGMVLSRFPELWYDEIRLGSLCFSASRTPEIQGEWSS